MRKVSPLTDGHDRQVDILIQTPFYVSTKQTKQTDNKYPGVVPENKRIKGSIFMQMQFN